MTDQEARENREEQAVHALEFILAKLKFYQINYVITGGFACYVYGVPRDLTDLDLDIDISKDDPRFPALYEELKDFITFPLQNFVDANYDNYNFEATYENIILDFCPMPDLKIFDPAQEAYVPFYKDGFPAHEVVEFKGIPLNLLAKNLIIENKEMLTFQRESDKRDIRELKKMLSYSPKI